MADEIKRLFEKNRVELAEQIVLDEAMWNRLQIDAVLSAAQRDRIKLNKTSFEQIMALLDFLEKRSDEAVIKFCMSLRATNQGHIADRLLTPSGPTKTFPTSNLPGDVAQAGYDIQRRSMRTIFEDDSIAAGQTGTYSPNSFVECLTKSRERIVSELEELDDILGYLVWNHVISQNQTDMIMTQKRKRNKLWELLDCVHRRGEKACRSLVVALRDTDQIQLCELSSSLKKELDQVPVREVLSIDQYMTEMKGIYKQKIENRNQQEQTQYGNSISLDQHEPVIINHGQRLPDAQTRMGFDEFNIQKTDRKQLTLDGIFLTDTDRRRPHSVLMLGGPGMGKTSLCFTILNRFAFGQWGGHHFIFLMLLKEFGDMGLSLTLADLLFDYNQTARTETQKQRLIRQLQKRQDRILFIFDGYDEHDEFMTDKVTISDPSTKVKPGVILCSLVRGTLLPHSQVLLTSRPFRQVDLKVNRVVEIAGLSDHSIYTLLGELLDGELGSETAAFLRNHDDVRSMLSIPINIQKFLSYLIWLRDSATGILPNLPKTKSSLYSKQMLPVLTQCLRLKDIHLFTEDEIWCHGFVQSFLTKLAKLASSSFGQFGKKQILFQRNDLVKCKVTEQEVKTGGLMSMFTKQTKTPFGVRLVVYFYFNHLTTLEWCGGLDTASRDIKYIENLIKHNDGNLDVVLIFCAGLLGANEGQLILKHLYDIPEQECQKKAQTVLNQIVSSDRCKKNGGPQFAIDVFFEASFIDPRPLLPLLAPDGQTLDIADIAMSNRQAVGYFIEQLNSSQDEQAGATGTPGSEIGIDTVRLHFTRAADRTVQNGIVAEVCKLKKLRHLLIEADGDSEVVVEMPLLHEDMRKDSAGRVFSELSGTSTLCLDSESTVDDIFADLPPEYAAVFNAHEKRAVMNLWRSVKTEKLTVPDISTILEHTQCWSSDEAVCSFPFHMTPWESTLTSKQNLPMAVGVYVPDSAAPADIQGCITQKNYIEQFPLQECRVGPLVFDPHGEQFRRPLAVLVALPDEIFGEDQQYDYIVQYSNDPTENTGDLNWEDVTSFREQHVSGVVLPQYRMAFLLMSHFSKTRISKRFNTASTELFAYWDDRGPSVRLTCLMYLETSYRHYSQEYNRYKKPIKMQEHWVRTMSVSRKKKQNVEVTVNDASPDWKLVSRKKEQEIEHNLLWKHSFPMTEFVFKSEKATTSFECNFRAQHGSSVVDIHVESFQPSGGQEVNTQDNAITELNLISDMAMDKLIRNRVDLAEAIKPRVLWNDLISNHVITKAMQDIIRLNRTEQEQVAELLDYIGTRPFTDYVCFCKALIKTNQDHVVRRWLWDEEWTTSIPQEHRAMFQKMFSRRKSSCVLC